MWEAPLCPEDGAIGFAEDTNSSAKFHINSKSVTACHSLSRTQSVCDKKKQPQKHHHFTFVSLIPSEGVDLKAYTDMQAPRRNNLSSCG